MDTRNFNFDRAIRVRVNATDIQSISQLFRQQSATRLHPGSLTILSGAQTDSLVIPAGSGARMQTSGARSSSITAYPLSRNIEFRFQTPEAIDVDATFNTCDCQDCFKRDYVFFVILLKDVMFKSHCDLGAYR